jgi:ubiquinone biosynthesis protein
VRGPHNIWRLIRTGATLERTGAMGVVLEAFRAPPRLRLVARILGWPFKWLGPGPTWSETSWPSS